jgi:sigma-E factor negative regulatory protein RseA
MVKEMTMGKNEHLSAVFDDEATDFESRRLLDELSKDDELKSTWSRYALMGESMRETPSQMQTGDEFLAALNARLADEPLYDIAMNDDVATGRTWLRPAAGMAAAVTVAVVALFSLQNDSALEQQTLASSDQRVASEVVASAPVVTSVESSGGDALLKVAEATASMAASPIAEQSAEPAPTTITEKQLERLKLAEKAQQERMRRYIASHMQYAPATTIAPSIRTVAYGF